MTALLAGFSIGFSLILAIGAQNAFVLRQGLRRAHVLAVVLTCAVSDALLIALGVTSFAAISARLPLFAPVLVWAGAAFLVVYGTMRFWAAWQGGEQLDAAEGGGGSLSAAVLTCLGLTWLNPHVYLDTVILVGSISTDYGADASLFGAGAITASFVFFFVLGYGARALAPVFALPIAWRILDVGIGLVMWALAAKLLLN
jgi:L-lysine exporter family protein LysE/ArgO